MGRRTLLTLSVIGAMALVGCGGGGGGSAVTAKTGASSVPAEFRHACGHPGAHVRVRHVPVTVRHADCDLTGVGISYRNYGGAYVPKSAGGVGNSSGFELTVHARSLDVTITAPKGPPGNA